MSTDSHTPVVIGLGGLLRSGKDTVADHLVEQYGFVKIGMSDPLRDALITLDPMVPDIEPPAAPWGAGRYIGAAEYIERWGYTDSKNNPEVRRLLQVLGTEVGRNMLGADTWVNAAKRTIANHLSEGVNVVITGIRFPNEIAMVRRLGGRAFIVQRPEPTMQAWGGIDADPRSEERPSRVLTFTAGQASGVLTFEHAPTDALPDEHEQAHRARNGIGQWRDPDPLEQPLTRSEAERMHAVLLARIERLLQSSPTSVQDTEVDASAHRQIEDAKRVHAAAAVALSPAPHGDGVRTAEQSVPVAVWAIETQDPANPLLTLTSTAGQHIPRNHGGVGTSPTAGQEQGQEQGHEQGQEEDPAPLEHPTGVDTARNVAPGMRRSPDPSTAVTEASGAGAGVHASESSLQARDFDGVIANDSTLEALFLRVDDLAERMGLHRAER